MTYMKNNVNIVLILLVVIVLLSIVGLTIFYQQNYGDLTERHKETSEELLRMNQNFTSTREKLNETSARLELKSSDKQQLNTLYAQAVNEKKKVEQDLAKTKEQVTSLTHELISIRKNLTNSRFTVISQNRTISAQLRRIGELRDDICASSNKTSILRKHGC